MEKPSQNNQKNKFLVKLSEYGNSINDGNSKKTNKLFDEIVKIYSVLKMNPLDVVPLLIANINDENEYISYVTSFLLLEFNPSIAEKKLVEISKKNGFAAFEAEWTLKEWKNGSIEFPPYK